MSAPIDPRGPGRYRLRDELRLTASAVCQPGKIMFWGGRKLLAVADLDKLLYVPASADGAMLAAADYERMFGASS